MAKYRLDALANLARQLGFTPHETRLSQVAAAEVLLHDLDPEKAYPNDYVVLSNHRLPAQDADGKCRPADRY